MVSGIALVEYLRAPIADSLGKSRGIRTLTLGIETHV
jgi:hypothetical protein